ncbi:DUF5908 family protein [uncultured Aquimarina sp.]|uniref:DUF5908 family protein n=1 Tax=uncultured Aquimarina sp. TaxID=575652 RepID=UPI00262546A6|nr:DUF5908 family protein [uncultured Aquimarina sp.]
MAVEIREIVIKAIVSDEVNTEETTSSEGYELDKNSMIQECVDQVLKVLKNKNRR